MARETLLALAILVLPAAIHAEEPTVPPEVAACLEKTRLEPDSIRGVRFISRDRAGAERVTVARIYGRRNDLGFRELLIRFDKPEEMRGAAFLMLEREGENEMYFRSPEFEKPKRISTTGRSSPLFGSDFSYEDFEHLQAFRHPGVTKLRDDDSISGRPVYVVAVRPSPDRNSAYDEVITFVDKETCIPLRIEFYEPERGLRKIVSVNPRRVVKQGDLWIPHVVMIQDIRDSTTTSLLVDSAEHKVKLQKAMFTLEGFAKEN
ncbi:MAG: outer membrane lipoprotein-sorting protein [Myxococcota bacterium]